MVCRNHTIMQLLKRRKRRFLNVLICKDLQLRLNISLERYTGIWLPLGWGGLTFHLLFLLNFVPCGSIFSLSTLLRNNLCTVRPHSFKMHNAMNFESDTHLWSQSRYRTFTSSPKCASNPFSVHLSLRPVPPQPLNCLLSLEVSLHFI